MRQWTIVVSHLTVLWDQHRTTPLNLLIVQFILLLSQIHNRRYIICLKEKTACSTNTRNNKQITRMVATHRIEPLSSAVQHETRLKNKVLKIHGLHFYLFLDRKMPWCNNLRIMQEVGYKFYHARTAFCILPSVDWATIRNLAVELSYMQIPNICLQKNENGYSRSWRIFVYIWECR